MKRKTPIIVLLAMASASISSAQLLPNAMSPSELELQDEVYSQTYFIAEWKADHPNISLSARIESPFDSNDFGELLRISIGTPTLAFDGKIEAEDIETKNISFPDYVFAADYNLRSLDEVESYIGEHSRLPDMPSADHIAENGMSVTETTNLMMRKIEELTLYMIDLKNENEQLKARLAELD